VYHPVDGSAYATNNRMSAQSMPSPVAEKVQTGRVLIADDQQHILFALQMLLRGSGFSTETVTHPARVLDALETESFDAVLMDLNYTRDTVGGAEGLDLVSKIRALDSSLPVVVMTAWSTVDLAVEAMRRGASDFVQKPWENRDLLHKLEQQLSLAREQRRKQRLHEEELRDAREIQHSLLPQSLPQMAGYEIAAVNRPLRFIGGDYYNVMRMDDRHTAICIADVAGKGMPAALLMSSLQAALQPLIAQKLSPGELCQRLNRILCDVMPLGKFISFFYGVLDSAENRLTYCNAGHNPPLMIRADGASSELSAEGAVLGQFPDWQYRQSELRIGSGDRMLLFTDGLVEACGANDDAFGEENVIRVARENRQSTAQDLMGALMGAASEHCGGRFQDDASLIVLKAS
jgi:sigma-B regulation protein RsbU (phosphoserine phosphatase)